MASDVPKPCDSREFPASHCAGADNRDAAAIDFAHLARQTLDDRALEDELLALFENQAARITAQLLALGAGEAKSRADLAHTLKGSTLAIGASRAARSAQAYEAACVAGEPSEAALDELIAALTQVRAAIAERLGRPSAPADGEA
jgi:HPt (histidine-containing phosphotransfer) domain-containing protein